MGSVAMKMLAVGWQSSVVPAAFVLVQAPPAFSPQLHAPSVHVGQTEGWPRPPRADYQQRSRQFRGKRCC